MVKIDLVTGFLGTGKTTFIRKYAKYLMHKGLNIGIIENDFGAINIDMLLLQDLECNQCDVEPIVGGNVISDWKRRFKAKLVALYMQGVDRVIVEPSGIYDVDAFFEVLYDEPVDAWYEIGSIFTLVDAKLDDRLSQQAEYLLLTQVACSGQILLSKTKDATEEQIQGTVNHLQGLLETYHCDQDISQRIQRRDWNKLVDNDYEMLMNCGWKSASYSRLSFDKNDVFTSLFFMNVKMPEERIKPWVEQFMTDSKYGTVFRIKGFFQEADESWIEVNATKEHMQINAASVGQEVVIVIGEALNQEAITAYMNQYQNSN